MSLRLAHSINQVTTEPDTQAFAVRTIIAIRIMFRLLNISAHNQY